jgi:hypothetical protein
VDLDAIDWHKTGLLVAVIAVGCLILWAAWRILRLLFRVMVVLGLVVVLVALVAWWMNRH